mmetsp:Transcript_12605/g.32636  ORF Transcript_12605/g.32636 Transcript_12605/m.32636 type:complete len:212 (-) Transcript_12605:966-1601(-)
MLPDRRHDKEELREDCSEGKHTTDEGGEDPADVPRLLGDLPRNLVRAHRKRDRSLLVAEEGTQKNQRDRDAKPEHEQSEHRRERNCTRGFCAPDEQVEDEEDAEDCPRVKEGGQKCRFLPILALPHLVEAGRDIPSENSREGEQQEHTLQDAATVDRRQETSCREQQRDCRTYKQLHPRPDGDREGLGVPRFPEDIAMHELPPSLLRGIVS